MFESIRRLFKPPTSTPALPDDLWVLLLLPGGTISPDRVSKEEALEKIRSLAEEAKYATSVFVLVTDGVANVPIFSSREICDRFVQTLHELEIAKNPHTQLQAFAGAQVSRFALSERMQGTSGLTLIFDPGGENERPADVSALSSNLAPSTNYSFRNKKLYFPYPAD
jgi:hypothetical protein